MRTLRDLAARYALDATAAQRLQTIADRVATDEEAPTTVTDPAAILRDHLADSLAGLELECVRAARVIADLGAGAGFPGLPLAVALPGAHVHLVESISRKCAFMDSLRREAGIENAEVVCARAEEWSAGVGLCDVVTARALAPLPVLAEYAAPLLAMGGALIAWRGRRDPADEAAAVLAAAELGLEVAEITAVMPYPGALHRHLHQLVKVAPTPHRFPRRAGMARKRPLGQGPRRAI